MPCLVKAGQARWNTASPGMAGMGVGMENWFDIASESLRRLEAGLRRLEAGLPPPRSHLSAMDIPRFSGKFSGPTLYDAPAGSRDIRREVSDLLAELDALAAKVRFQSQVQHDQAERIAALESCRGKGGRGRGS